MPPHLALIFNFLILIGLSTLGFFTQITVLAETTFWDTEFILESDTQAEGDKKGEVNDFELLSTLLARESKITN